MSRASPLDPPAIVEESLTNGVQDSALCAAASDGVASLGVSGDKPCGEKAKMGEETTPQELEGDDATEAAACNMVTVTAAGVAQTQVNAPTSWSPDEADQYLQSLGMSLSSEGSGEVSLGLGLGLARSLCG